MKKNKVMDFFSALGRSLMMPIAALAACGIVLGLTAALMKTQVLEAAPFLQQEVVFFIISTINKVSNVAFTLNRYVTADKGHLADQMMLLSTVSQNCKHKRTQ